jgi:hypothetical protein
MRGSKAVSLLKQRKFRPATMLLMSAFVFWPLMIIDLPGILLALKELSSHKQDQLSVPEVWPEWDE